MTEKSKKLIFWVYVGIISIFVILAIFVLISNNQITSENKQTQIILTQDNFVFLNYEILDLWNGLRCPPETCLSEDNNNERIPCPTKGEIRVNFKILNLDKEVNALNTEASLVDCILQNIQFGDQSNPLYNSFDTTTKITSTGTIHINYSHENSLLLCCKIDTLSIKSNEVCLPPIKVDSLC